MTINKFLPFAFIYFFVNSLFLPFGLTYTSLLAPLFYVWILLVRKKEIVLPFFLVLSPFIIIQLFIDGADLRSYVISLLNLLSVYIFCQAFYSFLKLSTDTEYIFRKILQVNFWLCLLAIPVFFSPFWHWLWLEQNITAGLGDFKRLKLFTYEPSHYALLFTPIFFFFLLQYFLRLNKIKPGYLLAMIFLPLILSFSIGVLAAILLAILLVGIIYLKKLLPKKRILNAVISGSAISLSVLMILVLFFRNNPLFIRITNITGGADTSAKGRTTDAFFLAQKILNSGNEYWGIGLGQLKLIGEDVIRSFYLYYHHTPVAIPNAAAETLLIFGWVGFSLRIATEIFLFFYTSVYSNYYRLLLFFFIFIYQFTGSYITNPAEYVIWILAFFGTFKQFQKNVNKVEQSQSRD